jgi:membrane protein YqaA with SNARE-associated domain
MEEHKPCAPGWIEKKINSPYVNYWFALLFALETFILFPLDIVVAIFALKKPNQIGFYSVLSALFSTIGAASGYLTGYFFWDTIGKKMIAIVSSPQAFGKAVSCYANNHGLVILATGMLPLPFKVFTIAAGFCQVPFFSFLFFISIVRWARYSLVMLATKSIGEKVITIMERITVRAIFSLGLKVSVVIVSALVLT